MRKQPPARALTPTPLPKGEGKKDRVFLLFSLLSLGERRVGVVRAHRVGRGEYD
jgi:hypothetical protein